MPIPSNYINNNNNDKWDVFICHASEDKDDFVKELALALSKKINVWYDDFILKIGDNLFNALEQGLKQSEHGIIVISKNFLKYWTGEEAFGLFVKESLGKATILPIWLNVSKEEVAEISPILAGRVAAKASDRLDKVVQELLVKIKPELLNTDASNPIVERRTSLPFGGSNLKLPCYFPSVSSVKTRFKPLHYIKLLTALNYPLFLVSAYDIWKSGVGDQQQIKKLFNSAYKKGRALIVDSGNYESYWKQDKEWSIKHYQDFLKCDYQYPYAFSFDKRDQNIGKTDAYKVINEIENRVKTEQKFSTCSIIPIVHSQIDSMISIVREVAIRLNPIMIAVPERELGSGLMEKVRTLKSLRTELNTLGQYYPIHLLGTGNPLSILIYSKYGADSFDGLEWCQTTVNHDTGLLYHFQQRELFDDDCTFCQDKSLPYDLATFGHNLYFFTNWMDTIQKATVNDGFGDLFTKYLPSSIIDLLEEV